MECDDIGGEAQDKNREPMNGTTRNIYSSNNSISKPLRIVNETILFDEFSMARICERNRNRTHTHGPLRRRMIAIHMSTTSFCGVCGRWNTIAPIHLPHQFNSTVNKFYFLHFNLVHAIAHFMHTTSYCSFSENGNAKTVFRSLVFLRATVCSAECAQPTRHIVEIWRLFIFAITNAPPNAVELRRACEKWKKKRNEPKLNM